MWRLAVCVDSSLGGALAAPDKYDCSWEFYVYDVGLKGLSP